MLSDPLAFLERMTATYGGVVGLVLGGEYVVLVSDPTVAKDVMVDRASVFMKVRLSVEANTAASGCTAFDNRSRYLDHCITLADDCQANVLQEGTAFFPGSQLAGNGLLVSDGPVWRRQRQLSNPAFRAAAVASYAEVGNQPSIIAQHH
jgi:cytochrome P450